MEDPPPDEMINVKFKPRFPICQGDNVLSPGCRVRNFLTDTYCEQIKRRLRGPWLREPKFTRNHFVEITKIGRCLTSYESGAVTEGVSLGHSEQQFAR